MIHFTRLIVPDAHQLYDASKLYKLCILGACMYATKQGNNEQRPIHIQST